MSCKPAQTNIQLYNQLLLQGYNKNDLSSVRSAYELSVKIFTGFYRGNGKPFISHLVGTASVIATTGGGLNEIIAGLLHSAYSLGEFGDGSRGANPKKRRMVREVVGEEIEQVIYNFPSLDWNNDDIIERLAHTPASELSGREQLLIWMRLAHEVEEQSDRAFIYSEKVSLKHLAFRLELAIRIAENLGLDELGRELDSLLKDVKSTDLPQAFDSLEQGGIIFIPPATHQEKFLLTAKRAGRSIRRKVRRQLNRIRLTLQAPTSP